MGGDSEGELRLLWQGQVVKRREAHSLQRGARSGQ